MLPSRWWLEQGNAVFEKGGFKAGDVESLIQQSHQFLWAREDVHAGVLELVQRLRDAQAWAHKVGLPQSLPGGSWHAQSLASGHLV